MRERTPEEKLNIRLRQLEEAKKRLGANDPALYDINDEREKIEEKLQILSKNAATNGAEDIRTQARNEPFGQDLNSLEDKNQKQRAANQILQNEPAKSRGTLSGEQAKVSAPPQADTSEISLKPKNETPGGRAMNALRRIRGGNKANTSGEAGAEGATAGGTGNAAAQAGKQFANKAAKAIKDGTKQLGKKIIQAIIKGGPVVWIICGVGLILIIILFVLGLSYMGTINKNVGASGGTALRQVNAKDDAGMLNNFAKQIGGTTATTEATKSAAADIATYMTSAKEDPAVKGNTALETAAKTAADAAATLAASPTTENATALTTTLTTFYNLLEGDIPVWPTALGSTRMPVTTITADTKFNSSIHGFSFLNNAQTDNHNVYIRSDDGKEMCDAVDIGVPLDTPVFPIFGGNVKEVSSDGNGASKVIITSSDGKYTALYAHITNLVKTMPDGSSHDLKAGDSLVVTEQIGTAISNNIQIEVYYTDSTGNSCLVTNHADMLDHALTAQRHADWGGYLWDRIVKTFNLK